MLGVCAVAALVGGLLVWAGQEADGSKDALLNELILDRAHWSDSARIRKLDELEAQGGPHTIEDVVRLIIEVETSPRIASVNVV